MVCLRLLPHVLLLTFDSLILIATLITPTGSLILLSDGFDLKLHSSGSSSISFQLRHRPNGSRQSRIPAVDYAGFEKDTVTVVWLEPPYVMFGSLNLTSRNLTQTKAHSFPFNATDVVVDRFSCQRDVILAARDQDTIWKLDANTFNLTPLVQNADNVSKIFAVNGDIYWITGRRCLFRREILSHDASVKNNETCLSDTSSHMAAVFVSHADGGSDVYILSSVGDVYRLHDRSAMVKIIAREAYKDRKILKYERNDFDSLYVTSSSVDSHHVTSIFVGIKNHGILLKIVVQCPENHVSGTCKILSMKDELSEDRLYDFKVLADPGINCSDFVTTIRSQVLRERATSLRLSYLVYGHVVKTTWIAVFALFSLLLIGFTIKMIVGLFTTSSDNGKRFRDLVSGGHRHQDRRSILRRSPSNNSTAGNPLNFPSKDVLQATPVLKACAPPVRTISIEDLSGFENPSFDGRRNRTHSQRSCDSCDYKDECKEMGICLNTYSRLHH